MKDEKNIEAVVASVCEMFAEQSRQVVESFAKERKASHERYKHLVETSEVRLVNANKMVAHFSESADKLSDLQHKIATTYTEQIEKLSKRADDLNQVVTEQQAYIRILQDKIDDRDERIKDLLRGNAKLNDTVSTLIDRALHSQPLMANNFAPQK